MCLRFQSKSESGNVFLAIFGAIALVGLLGAAVMTFMKGPLATSVRLTKINTAENQMQIGSQVAVMATANQANSGDCDSDGYVEPIEWRAATTEPYPTNGGLVPLSLGISKKDPWGTEYGYCVWNHGATISGSGCDANMLGGAVSTAYPVVALISAGPDKAFTTTCRDFATADVNSDGDLADATDLSLVSKAAETDDDIISSFTYQEATGASGGLWNIKAGTPQTATIGKNIETTGSASLGGGLLLPDKALVTCDATSTGVMAMNGNAIEMCNGTSWLPITGGSSKLDDETVQTDLMCDTAATGQLRYNTNSGGGGGISFVGANSGHTPGNGGTSSLTMTISAPAGISAGDILLYAINDDVCGTLTWPSGFTEIERTDVGSPDGQCWAIAYKVAVGNETDLTVSDTNTWAMSGSVIAYSGVDTANPIGGSSQKNEPTSSGPWTMMANSLTTTTSNTQIIWFGAADTDNTASGWDGSSSCVSRTTDFTVPNGFTERLDIQGLLNPDTCYNSMAIADATQVTVGATGGLSGTLTSTTGGTASTGIMLIALNPASGGGGGSGTKKVEVCDGTSWTEVGSPPPPSTSPIKLETETVNTDVMCDGTNLGLMRYNTTGTSTTDTLTASGGASGSISFVGVNSSHTPGNGGRSSLTLTVPAPAGISAGDILLYAVNDDGCGTLTWPPGFTELQRTDVSSPDGQCWAIAYKVATGSETNLSYNDDDSWSVSGSVIAYSGVDTTNPIAGSSQKNESTSAGPWTMIANSLTTTAANSQIVWFGAADTDNDSSGWSGTSSCSSVVTDYTAPSGFTERADIQGLLDPYTCFNSMAVADGLQATAGATGGLSGTLATTTGGYASTGTMLVALNPASGGGGGGSGGTTTVSGSSYAQVCNGTEWVTVGSGFLDNLNDVITNYTGSAATGKQSTTSMFIGKGVGATAESGATNNTAMGSGSMAALTTGSSNTAIGTGSLAANTTGGNNLAIGSNALNANTTGDYNTAIGVTSLFQNTTGASNTALGYQALFSATTAQQNTALGYQALFSAQGNSANTAVGYQALKSATGAQGSVAIGTGALYSNQYADNNVAVGPNALYNATSGLNVAVGTSALSGTTTGAYNTALGSEAGNAGTANTIGDYNTFIGYQAQADADNYTNSTALGNGATITASNQIVLGNSAVTEIRAQVTSITAISDKRLKKDIEPSELGLFFIDSLRPVQYRYNNGDNTLRYGFIAQETESVLPDNLKSLVGKESGLALVNHDHDKDQTYHMTYGELTAPIVKAIQELSANLADFIVKTKETIATIFAHNKEQDAEIKNLRAEVERLKLSCDKK